MSRRGIQKTKSIYQEREQKIELSDITFILWNVASLFNLVLMKYLLFFCLKSLKDATQTSEAKKKIQHVTWPWC